MAITFATSHGTVRRPILLALALCATEAAAQGVDSAALQRLDAAARAAHSDALVVLQHGQVVRSWDASAAPTPIPAMSVTKSIANLAIGRLLTTGRLRSLDTPLATFFPEWQGGPKAAITLRHVMEHTSGLRHNQAWERSPDRLRLALEAPLEDVPGTRYVYNNTAVELVSGVVARVTGQPLDAFVAAELFQPLGIHAFGWSRDSAGLAGAYAGLDIRPADLATIGQFVLQRGAWQGVRLIRADWFDHPAAPPREEPRAALLWHGIPSWLAFVIDDAHLAMLSRAGVDSGFLREAQRARGRFTSIPALTGALATVFGPKFYEVLPAQLNESRQTLYRVEAGPMIGLAAFGYLGQQLIILPESGIVAVRMIRSRADFNAATDSFDEFPTLVRALVPSRPPLPSLTVHGRRGAGLRRGS